VSKNAIGQNIPGSGMGGQEPVAVAIGEQAALREVAITAFILTYRGKILLLDAASIAVKSESVSLTLL
jgi:hypothetical protein